MHCDFNGVLIIGVSSEDVAYTIHAVYVHVQSHEDVEKMGVANYNAECRKIVMRYSMEWEETVTRMGRWIDFKNDYKTLYPWFMESIWYDSLCDEMSLS